MASVEVNQMLAAAVAASEDKKAEDIRVLALDPSESGLTDYFLICTGSNDRQTVAITDEIELRMKRDFGVYPNSVEGRRQGEWILMDYVDFIVHVFLPEKRAFYGLERLRKSATTLSVDDLNNEIKSAIKAKRPAQEKKTGEAPSKKPAGKKSGPAKAAPSKTAKKAARKATGKQATKKASAKKTTVRKSAKAAAKRSTS